MSLSNAIFNKKYTEINDLKEILKTIAKSNDGIILRLPWKDEVNGVYSESIEVLAIKVTKEKLYFINPLKVNRKELTIEKSKVTKKDKLHFQEQDGKDSISLVELFKLSKTNNITAIVEI